MSSLITKVFDLGLIGSLTLSPLLGIFYVKSLPGEDGRRLQSAKADLRCLSGQCFLMPQESYFVEPLRVLETRVGYVGDRVLTLGEESELEIAFPDSSKLILRNTSLLSIQKGRGTMLRDLEKGFNSESNGNEDSEDSKKQKPQSIIYSGDLPLEILYPAPDSEIVPESFPAQVRVTFRLASRIQSDAAKEATENFKKWTLYSVDSQETPTRISEFEFNEDGLKDHFSQLISIQSPGLYLLAPSGLDAGLSYNGFRFSVFDRSQLESKIQNLLDNYEDAKDKPLEIRQR